jgi:hypothetical protein
MVRKSWFQRGFVDPATILTLGLIAFSLLGITLGQRYLTSNQTQDIRSQANVPADPCKVCNGSDCVTIASYPYCDDQFNECAVSSDCITPTPTQAPCAKENEYCGQGGLPCCQPIEPDGMELSCTGDYVCRRANDSSCTDNTQCATGWCNNDGKCAQKKLDGQSCSEDVECISNLCLLNICTSPTPIPTRTPTPKPSPTPPPCAKENEYCGQGGLSCCQQSVSGWNLSCSKDYVCKRENGEVCYENSQCITNFCNHGDYYGLCEQKALNGEYCEHDGACISNYCYEYRCAIRPTPTPTPICAKNNEYCGQGGLPCCSGHFCSGKTYVCEPHYDSPACTPGQVTCLPPNTVGYGSILATCNADGKFIETTCSNIQTCDEEKKACIDPLSNQLGYYQPCRVNEDCLSGKCDKDPADNTYVCVPNFSCSDSGEFALAMNYDSGWQLNQTVRCQKGCDPTTNYCRDNERAYCNSQNEGKTSYDGAEMCKSGNWVCREGWRRRITTPAINVNHSHFEICQGGQWQFDQAYTDNYYGNLYCKDNQIWQSDLQGTDNFIKTCPTKTYCLDKSVGVRVDCYSFEKAGNYFGCAPDSVTAVINNKEKICQIPFSLSITQPLPYTHLSYEQFNALIEDGVTCQGIDEVFNGTVKWWDSLTRNCRLYCDSEEKRVKRDYCHLAANPAPRERFCKDNNVYQAGDSLVNLDLIETCQDGCANGFCIKKEDGPCSLEGAVSPSSPTTFLVCENGTWQQIATGHKIEWFGCPHSFMKNNLTYIARYSELVPNQELEIHCYQQSEGMMGWVQPGWSEDKQWYTRHMGLSCGHSSSKECEETLVHEMVHSWEIDKNKTSDYPETNSFNEVIGCRKNSEDSTYEFKYEKAVTGYGNTSCGEAIAEAAPVYVNLDTSLAWESQEFIESGLTASCWMKLKHPKQYDWFLNHQDSPFKGKEWCSDKDSSQTSIRSSQAFAQTITPTPTPAPHQYKLVAGNKVGNKITTNTISKAVETKKVGDYTYYSFDSNDYGEPHVIQVDGDNQITFISLTLPYSKIYQHTSEVRLLGKPKVMLEYNPSSVVLSYPGIGKAYIVNRRDGLVSHVWLFNQKTRAKFVNEEGKHYPIEPLPHQRKLPDFDFDNDVDYIDLSIKTTVTNLIQQFNLFVKNMGKTR